MRYATTTGLVLLFALLSTTVSAQSDAQWMTIKDPSELRDLVTNRAMENATGYWVYYVRADGKMAYLNRVYDSLVFREWMITADGALCSAVYGFPDKVVECLTIQRTSGNSSQYRMKDEPLGAATFQITNPPQELVDALIEKTGTK